MHIKVAQLWQLNTCHPPRQSPVKRKIVIAYSTVVEKKYWMGDRKGILPCIVPHRIEQAGHTFPWHPFSWKRGFAWDYNPWPLKMKAHSLWVPDLRELRSPSDNILCLRPHQHLEILITLTFLSKEQDS